MERLEKIQLQRKITLPQIYIEFFDRCATSMPKQLVGTDLINEHIELNDWAKELLEEDSAEFSLEHNDFVFLMHQGYIFCYFKANGNSDPDVYRYTEKKLKSENIGKLSHFINSYID